jgi:peroxiredoxin
MTGVSAEHGRPSGRVVLHPRDWCPLCMAQSKAIAERYREIEARGAEVALVAGQDADHSRQLADNPRHRPRCPEQRERD